MQSLFEQKECANTIISMSHYGKYVLKINLIMIHVGRYIRLWLKIFINEKI